RAARSRRARAARAPRSTASIRTPRSNRYRASWLVNSGLVGERHIVGLGGGGDTPEQTLLLYDYALALTGRERPRVLFVPTAVGDADPPVVTFYEPLSGRGEPSVLRTFPWPPAGLRELILSQDAICVSGGNTANMLAIW